MIDEAFATVLRDLRKRKGWSQESFAFKVGIHRTYVSQLERGLKSPSLKTLQKIALAFNISLTRLMNMIEDEIKRVPNSSVQSE